MYVLVVSTSVPDLSAAVAAELEYFFFAFVFFFGVCSAGSAGGGGFLFRTPMLQPKLNFSFDVVF